MWRVSYYDPNDNTWFFLSDNEGKPIQFRTHDSAYSEMLILQKEGFEAYTEKSY